MRVAARFVLDLRAGGKPRWLSLLGSSGAGKTHIAKRIHEYVKASKVIKSSVVNDEVVYAEDYCQWPQLAKALQQNKGRNWLTDLQDVKFLTLDDIGAAKDKTGFITGELSVMLGLRTEKWTVITANLSLDEVSKTIDTRIASRMLRGGSEVVDITVEDFALRQHRQQLLSRQSNDSKP